MKSINNKILINLLLDCEENKKISKKDLILKFKRAFLFNTTDNESDTTSWGWVKSIREGLQKNAADSDWADSLERQWQTISSHHPWDESWVDNTIEDHYNPADTIRLRDIDSYESPVKDFMNMMEGGFYPPPEILLTISDAFKIYFMGGGDISLEEAFFGSPIKGVGNYAARSDDDDDYKKFHLAYEGYLKAKRHKISFPRFTEKYFNGEYHKEMFGEQHFKQYGHCHGRHYKNIDIDSFLRGYRRWKKYYIPLGQPLSNSHDRN